MPTSKRWYHDIIPSGRLKIVRYTPRISSRDIVARIAGRVLGARPPAA